jgi:hypothetical protein
VVFKEKCGPGSIPGSPTNTEKLDSCGRVFL